jgi:outer membrane receptor protein involved in Fe transport
VSYAEARLHTENDFTAFYGPQLPVLAFFGYNYPANTGVAYQSTIPQKKKSAELRFVSNRLGPVEFILGGFYTNERVAPLTTDIVTRNTTTNTELPAPLGSLIASPIRDRYEELSGFGNVTFYLTNNFDITGGVRYAHYTEKFSLNYTGVFYSPPLGAPQTLGLDASEDHASYLATVRWRPTSTLSVFARAASGFRPGGPQPAVNPPAGAQRLIKPDTVWNYEAGIKGDFLNKTLSLEASVYRIDWKNIQLYTIFQNQVVLANAGQARVEGFEFAALARPTNLLSIGVNAGYTNPRITKIDPGVSSVIGAAVGDTIPQTPHWTVSATADQSIPLGGNVQGQLGATMRFQSEMYTSYPSSVTAPNVKLPSITTVDLRAGLSFGSYQLQLRVENVLNERGLINYAPGSPGVPATANISRPRTFSLAVSTKF